jgi:hypothetical protein
VIAGELRTRGRSRPASGASVRSGLLPNLVVIGAQKCGTSSLHRYLDLHPEISMSRPKELNFFIEQLNWPKGLDWYTRHFRDAPVRGESSVNYTSLPGSAGTPDRMHSILPDARLIYIVRDPFERLVSHYIHLVGLGREWRPIDEAVQGDRFDYLTRGLYATQLEPFLDLYGADRIHVEAQEDLLADRAATMRRVFEFLGVDPGFTSPGFERIWEASAGKDRKYRVAVRLSRRIGGRRWSRLPTPLRWSLERIAYRPLGGGVKRPRIDDAVRERLAERFRPEVERLRALTGREFTEWDID